MIFSWLEFCCSLNLWFSYCKHPFPVVGSTLNGRLLFFMNRFTGSTFCHQSLSICFLENSDFLLSIAWASLSFSRLILCISCLLWTVAGALPVAEAVEAIVLLCLFPGVKPRDIVWKSWDGKGRCYNCLSITSRIYSWLSWDLRSIYGDSEMGVIPIRTLDLGLVLLIMRLNCYKLSI